MSDKSPHSHPTPESERVAPSQKIGFGFGAMCQTLGTHSIGNLANFVFNIGLGVNPFLVGLAQSIPRLWDALSDPLMGHLSDNTRTRWGRRRPYMFIGAILTGLTFAAIWIAPDGWSEYAHFTYFLGISLLFYTALTVFMVPWGALGLEMTRDYRERTRIQAVANFAGNLGALVMPWLFALTELDFFEDGVQGARVVGAGMGLILVVTGLIPAILCREVHYDSAVQGERLGLWKGIKTTCSNRNFLLLMGTVLLGALGFFTVNSLTPYILIYHVFGGEMKAASLYIGWSGTAWVVSSLLFVAPVTWTANRIGKKPAFLIFMAIHLFGHVIKIWCYNPAHPWLAILPPIFVAGGFVALWTVGASMMADICDEDELLTGARREGSFAAIYGWILKSAMSLAFLLGGLLLVASGFDEALGGAQSGQTLLWLRILEAGIPSLAVLAAMWTLSRYSLTESRLDAIRSEIQRRADASKPDVSGR